LARHALIIGIGDYPDEDWNLPAAVPDAIRFKDWVVTHGGVEPANVRLLLSPWPENLTDYPKAEADRRSIITAIQQFQTGAGQGGERLYFYYAGHGVSAPGVTTGGIQEPVIIPADVTSLRTDAALLIGFSEIMPALLACEPREQFYFIDACRDFALEDEFQPGVGRSGIRWMPPNPGAGPRSAQYVLYSTSPGLKAYEKEIAKRGVFADALLEALGGIPKATQWSTAQQQYVVRWSTLVDYAREVVAKRVTGADRDARGVALQLPEATTQGGGGDPDLLAIDAGKMAPLNLRVRLVPSGARPKAKVQVLYYPPGGLPVPIKTTGPPLESGSGFLLPPGDYALEATSDSYTSCRRTCRLWSASVEEFELTPQESVPADPGVPPPVVPIPGPPTPPMADPVPPNPAEIDAEAEPKGAEPAAVGDEAEPSPEPAPDPAVEVLEAALPGDDAEAPPTIAPTGQLDVECTDPGAHLTVWDGERRTVADGSGSVGVALTPGIYRIRMTLATGDIDERTAEVRPGETATVTFGGGSPEMGSAQLAMLERLGIRPEADGTLQLSEGLGGFSRARLASLLGMAAFSATGPFVDQLPGLHRFGIDGVAEVPAGSSPVLVLLGGSGDKPLPDVGIDQLLSRVEVVVRARDGSAVDHGGFDLLAAFPAAAQRSFVAPVGAVTVELRLAGVGVIRYALACLPDRRTVLVLVAEDDGVLDVQQYSIPLQATTPGAQPLLDDARNIRRLEVAQRYFAGPADLRAKQEFGDVLGGKWLDPLLGASVGYSVIAQGDAAAFEMGLLQMLKEFPGLPDSHVLAGLCHPDQRAEHYGRALEMGLPVFSEGLRVLQQWFREAGAVPSALSEPSRRLIPGSVWTAWVATRPVLTLRDGSFGCVPLGWQSLEQSRREIERTCASVGRMEWVADNPAHEFVGTGFLVAPGVVLTASFIVEALYEQNDGVWQARDGRIPQIDFAEELGGTRPLEFPITGVVGIDRDRQLGLLAIAAQSRSGDGAPAPLSVATARSGDVDGRGVYVVGYPTVVDPRVDPAMVASSGDASGVKRLQPGRILGSGDDVMIAHDCSTLAGNSGSPLIELHTGLVVGVHLSGKWLEYKTGEARALWGLNDIPLLRDVAVNWVAPPA